jgi:hypothetical protein
VVVVTALLASGTATVMPVQSASAQAPSTQVLVPSSGATVSGTKVVLDAAASAGTTQVQFELTGGTLSGTVIATATPSAYGWIAQWDSTTASDGTYTVQSVATSSGSTTTSAGVSITVQNGTPSVSVVVPSFDATISGSKWLDALASPGVVRVSFAFIAVNRGFIPPMLYGCYPTPSSCISSLGDAVPTAYGWLANLNTANYPDGLYTVRAIALYANGMEGITSSPVAVANGAPTVVVPSNNATVSGTQWLDCAIPPNTTGVQFWFAGVSVQLLGNASPTVYGWLFDWDTTTVSPGTYEVFCSADYPASSSVGMGRGITVTVSTTG